MTERTLDPFRLRLAELTAENTRLKAVVDAAREQVAACNCEGGMVEMFYLGDSGNVFKEHCPKCSRFRKPLADLDAADG